jgi:hypothetical protein
VRIEFFDGPLSSFVLGSHVLNVGGPAAALGMEMVK